MLLSFTQIHFRLRHVSVPRPLGAFAWLLHCLIYKVHRRRGLSSARIQVRPLSGELDKYTMGFFTCQYLFFHIFNFFVQNFSRSSKGMPRKLIARFTVGTTRSDKKDKTRSSGAIKKLSASAARLNSRT